MRKQEKKYSVYVSFIDLVNTVNREGLLQVLIMYDEGGGVGDKLLSGTKNVY